MKEAFRNKSGYTDAKKGQIVDSLLQVVYTIKLGLTPQIVMYGYRFIGQWPIDFMECVGKCTNKLSLVDSENIRRRFPVLVQYSCQHGHLTERVIDELNIMSDNDYDHNKVTKD